MDVIAPEDAIVDELGSLVEGVFVRERREVDNDLANTFAESRASRLSTVERRIIKDSDQCPLCIANNDPRKVPVHPNCHCDVITDTVETGTADPDSRFFETLTPEMISMLNGEFVGQATLLPETTAVLDLENVRFADLARWLEQMQPYLEASNNAIAIVVDDDSEEAAQQIEESIGAIAESIENLPEELQNRKLWFSIAKAVV